MGTAWAPQVLPAVVAALGSSSLTAWVAGRIARRQHSDHARAADLRDTQDRLHALRDGCRRRALEEPEAPSLADLAGLRDALDLAAARTLSDAVLVQTRDYIEVVARFAVRDGDATDGIEEQAYRSLCDVLREALRPGRR